MTITSQPNKECKDTKVSFSNDDSKMIEGNSILYLSRLLSSQRALAYASEVGESFRPQLPRHVVTGSWILSGAYVVADVHNKSSHCYATTPKPEDRRKHSLIRAGDALLFHSAASMVIPGLTIHSIVKKVGQINFGSLMKTCPKVCGWIPTLVGLASIPIIIKPIDEGTLWTMNKTIRKLYPQVDCSHH